MQQVTMLDEPLDKLTVRSISRFATFSSSQRNTQGQKEREFLSILARYYACPLQAVYLSLSSGFNCLARVERYVRITASSLL